MSDPDFTSASSGAATSASIPVVRVLAPVIHAAECKRLSDLAARLMRDEAALADTSAFGSAVTAGLGSGPKLLVGDLSEIPLLSKPGSDVLGYRIALLAAQGDMVALGHAPCPAFERYLANLLGIDGFTTLALYDRLRNDPEPLAQRCLHRPEVLERIVREAVIAGSLTVVPHITTGNAWLLASTIAARAGTPIAVCGPPPRLTLRVNDKLWFAERVRDVLGERAIPPTFAAHGSAVLAGHVARLARQWDRVVVKIPDSAGSAGNLPIDSTRLRGLSLARLRVKLNELMRMLGWGERYPLMVEVWDCEVLASPSVQIWIPRAGNGQPIIDGVFEQVVEGAEGSFVGATQAVLPDRWTDRLGAEAMRLAMLFQNLGYFGRCSLDAVIFGGDIDTAELHWIECNGRWGGVSLPMTLANRVCKERTRLGLAIVQQNTRTLAPRPFAAALDQLSDLLLAPGARPDGIVLTSPMAIERGTGIHLVAIATDREHACRLADEAAARLREPVSTLTPGPNR